MRSALLKDTLRTVGASKRRFAALAAICVLGVTMLIGITIACEDLLLTADEFYDAQRLYDVSVQSTLGLSDSDVSALGALDGVETAEGGYGETAYTEVGDSKSSVEVHAFTDDGMNEPYLVEGSLPSSASEVAVTSEYLEATGKSIGDTVTFGVDSDEATWAADDEGAEASSDSEDEEDSDELFARHTYTITASVVDPTSMAAKNGSSSFRATGAKYSFYVSEAAATSSAYSVVYLRVAGASELNCFSGEYQELVDGVTAEAETIKAEREAAREAEVTEDASSEIDDAEKSANDQFQEVEDQLAEAQQTIDDAVAQIESGKAELASQRASAAEKLASAQAQINSGLAQLEDPATRESAVAEAKAAAAAALEENEQYQTYAAQLKTLKSTKESYDQLTQSKAQLESAIAQAEAVAADTTELRAQLAQVEAGITQIEQALVQQGMTPDMLPATIQAAEDGMASAKREAEDAAVAAVDEQLTQSKAQLDEAQAELDSSKAQLDAALAEGQAQLESAQAQADEGQAELDENRAEYEEQKAEALQKIADARAKLAEIGSATWYVQDRSAISSFSSIDSDASSIEVIGTVFPVIFLTVAVLMSLTTATRMVEEERELIGLYKALGYKKRSIMGKYVAYTAAAACVGCAIGCMLGFVALPLFLFQVFAVMYVFPAFTLHFSAVLCAIAVGMFVLGISLATAATVGGELSEQPAQLMRPRAPKAGKRILLERIPLIWNRMSFLNKVTARNLFRYKKRLAMTVFGVAGCCALMIAGFAIRDTVLALCPNQYGSDSREGIYAYDVMAVTQPDDLKTAAASLTADSQVTSYTSVRTENVTVTHDGSKNTVQLVVVPEGFSLDGYINLKDEAGNAVSLEDATADGSVLVTKSVANVLGLSSGSEVSIQDTTLATDNATVKTVLLNYLGDTVYMTEATYESLFGKELETNALIAKLAGTDEEKIAYANGLSANTMYLSVTSIQDGVKSFTTNFMLINYVVVLIIALAAGLSFVVLFTLSTTNVSERERELATIKVLGFRKPEVRTYINKEMLILALIGTLVGIPLGTLLGHALTYVLVMPSMYFAVEIAPMSYVYSCGLSIVFAIVVCLITRPTIDKIDMVGALKSAE